MRSTGFGRTDVGRVRENNEDAMLVDDRLGIYAVADGVGGHAAGDVASKLAVDAVRDAILAVHASTDLADADHAQLKQVAGDAVRAACARVYEQATTVPALSGMGCTLTLLLTSGAKAVMAHVGDTRLYLCREGSTWQLSADHTLAADLVRRGEVTPDEAQTHPYSSALTRALGAQRAVDPETLILDVLPDDVFLLCSDGLSRYVEGPGELSAALGRDDFRDAPDELVERAIERGGEDNVTAVVVRIDADAREQEEPLSRDVRLGLAAVRRVPAFEDARFVDLLRVFNVAELREYRAGEDVVPLGHSMHALYVPIAGELRVEHPDGSVTPVEPGGALGSTSLLVPRTSTARVTARSEARLLTITGDAFMRLARRRPWMGVRVLTTLARELAGELPGADPRAGTTSKRWWNPATWSRGATR